MNESNEENQCLNNTKKDLQYFYDKLNDAVKRNEKQKNLLLLQKQIKLMEDALATYERNRTKTTIIEESKGENNE